MTLNSPFYADGRKWVDIVKMEKLRQIECVRQFVVFKGDGNRKQICPAGPNKCVFFLVYGCSFRKAFVHEGGCYEVSCSRNGSVCI